MSTSSCAACCATRLRIAGGTTVLAIVFTSAVAAAAAQDWARAVSGKLTREPIVGLLNLPDIVDDPCGPPEPQSAALYAAPAPSATLVATLRYLVTNRAADGATCDSAKLVVRRANGGSDEDLPTEETGYEVAAAIVYERSGDWYRIALQRGSAWIFRQNQNDFESYPELLMDKLAYIDAGWDGRLSATPEPSTGRPAAEGWTRYIPRGIDVTVLAIRRSNGRVWIQVRLETDVCGETRTGVTSATGWIPAYEPAGTPSVWFFSRGC